MSDNVRDVLMGLILALTIGSCVAGITYSAAHEKSDCPPVSK